MDTRAEHTSCGLIVGTHPPPRQPQLPPLPLPRWSRAAAAPIAVRGSAVGRWGVPSSSNGRTPRGRGGTSGKGRPGSSVALVWGGLRGRMHVAAAILLLLLAGVRGRGGLRLGVALARRISRCRPGCSKEKSGAPSLH